MQLSVWEKESFFDEKDLVIVGSGFVGLWCAYHYKLRNPNAHVLILERGLIPTGASTRNAGFACFGSVTELLEDSRQLGIDKMLSLTELRFKGLQLLQQIIPASSIDFSICGGYDLLTEMSVAEKASFTEQMQWINQLLQPITGVDETFCFADHKIDRFGFTNIGHLVENKLEGYLHSGKLCQQLLSRVQGLGVTVVNNFEVTGYSTEANETVIHSSAGITIRTNRLLFCTNAFVKELLPELDVVPARGQILVTSPIDDLKLEGTFHFDHGYYYFRNLGKRLLIGGARNKAFAEEETTSFDTTNFIQSELELFVAEHILKGRTFTVTDRWSGIMAMGSEKKPIIRELSPNVWCAVRMSGMGVALAPLVGKEVAEMMH